MSSAPETIAGGADAVLLERLRRRDRTAWDEVYRLYEGRLYGFSYRLTGNPHDAADLVQETFVRALPRLDRLPPERADVAAYLFATAKNLFLKDVARSKRQQPTDEVPEPDEPAAIEDDPQRAALLRRQQAEVRIANGRLAPRQRLVLALRELEDKSYAEIGELVGLNENAVAQLISRARQSLREELRLVQVDRSKLPETCQAMLPLLSAYLDGQLKGARGERVVAHVEGCEACQAALADMREASRRYRLLVPPVLGTAALKDRVDEALGATGYWDGPAEAAGLGRLAALRGKTAAVVAAGGLVVAGGLGVALALTLTGDPAPAVAPVASPAAASEEQPAAATGAPQASVVEAAGTTTDGVSAAATAPAQTAEETIETAPAATDEATVAGTTDDPESGPTETDTEAATTGEDGEPEPAARAPGSPTFLSGPDDPTTRASAAFRFTAPRAESFQCRLDGGDWVACASGAGADGLAPGRHVFSVRARSAAGTGPASSYAWTIERAGSTGQPPATTGPPATTAPPAPPPDTEPPTVSITQAPPSPTSAASATISFKAGEPATFACSLDGGAFAPCASPRAISGLGPGTHVFAVRATDEAGNTGPAASVSWVVSQPLPDLVVSSLTGTSVTVTNVGGGAAGAFVIRVVPGGTFTVGGLAPGASATRTFACVEAAVAAVADSGAQVAEASEGNNTASITNVC